MLLFAADGRMARLPVHRLPDGNAIHPADLGAFVRNDRLVAALALDRDDDAEDPSNFWCWPRARARQAGDVREAGRHRCVNRHERGRWRRAGGRSSERRRVEIVLVTKLAQAIRFAEADVRPMGLPAAGVWGMKLSSGDEVVRLGLARPKAELVIVTTTGFFKRTPMSEFPVQGRHGGGVAAIRLAQKSGAIADARVAEPADEFFSASRKGTLRKLDLSEIPAAKRSAQGKLLIQPAQGDTIVALLHLPSQRSSGEQARGSTDKKRRPAEPSAQPPAPERSPEFEFEEASLFDVIEEADLPAGQPQAKPARPARGKEKPVSLNRLPVQFKQVRPSQPRSPSRACGRSPATEIHRARQGQRAIRDGGFLQRTAACECFA